jgi:hypothetical protein
MDAIEPTQRKQHIATAVAIFRDERNTTKEQRKHRTAGRRNSRDARTKAHNYDGKYEQL